MFKSIKYRIIKGSQLLPFATAKVLQDHEDRIKALENDSPAPSPDPEPTPEPVTRNLSFTVNDGTNPVEGATVTIGSVTGNTGSQGGCTLQGISDGSQTVTVTKEGFTEYTDTITVSEESTSFTVSLTAE